MGEEVIFPTAWKDQGTRKTAFADLLLGFAEREGYSVGASLKVQGAYAFEMHREGQTRKIGMKSAYDRTLNTAYKMVEKVDEVWIMTFRWSDPARGDEVPTHLEIYSVDPKALLAVYEKVHAAREKAGKQNAMSYIPLDADRLSDPVFAPYDVVAGNILKIAKPLFEAPLKFENVIKARIENADSRSMPTGVVNGPTPSLAEQVFQHKEALAKLYGTTPDKVRIIVEA